MGGELRELIIVYIVRNRVERDHSSAVGQLCRVVFVTHLVCFSTANMDRRIFTKETSDQEANPTGRRPPRPRRGRPAGSDRVPLSLKERRARNAHYERERRNELSEAVSQLAEAAGHVADQLSTTDLLADVIGQLRRASKRKAENDVNILRQANRALESESTSGYKNSARLIFFDATIG